MTPVNFAHIYTFSRRFHPKRLIQEEQKQFVKEDDLPLCIASTMKPYAILCSCLMVLSACLCIYGCEYAKRKLSSELLKRESQCKDVLRP